ncbi:MAG: tetratricopeptide repeat protein [Acidobacteriota bacterium]
MSLSNAQRLSPIILILLITAICYWNSLSGGFVADDLIVVVNNDLIKSIKTFPTLFVKNYWGDGYDDGIYRPLTNATFALDYAIHGLQPWGYHLTNLLLHALNGWLVYWLVRRYCKKELLAQVSALLFIAHPVHTEAVSYIAGRTELLAATFALLSWVAYCQRERGKHYYWLALLSYLLGLLAKESAIVLLAVLILADLCTEQWRTQWTKLLQNYLGFFVVAVIYIILRIAVLKQLGVPENWVFFKGESFSTRLFTMSQAFIRYFELLVWPANLCTDYDYGVIAKVTTINLPVALSLLLIGGIFAIGCWLLPRAQFIAFAILFFFITISTVSNILLPTGILMADRVLYLPVASICLLAAGLLDRIAEIGRKWRTVAIALTLLLLVAAAVRDYYRNIDWHDQEAFVYALVNTAPNNIKGQICLGILYGQQGRHQEAEQTLKRAISLAPDKAVTHGRLGEFYVTQGRFDEAQVALEHSLQISTRFDFVYAALARVYSYRGEKAKAVAAFQQAIALGRASPHLYQELAVALLQLNDYRGSIAQLEKALELKPDFAEAHNNLAVVLRSLGQQEAAREHFHAAATLEPNNAVTRNAYGATLLNLGRLAEAEREFTAAIKIDANFAEAYNNLGVVYIQQQRYQEAREKFETALRLRPDYTNAARNLAMLQSPTK